MPMNTSVRFQQGRYGVRAVVSSAWSDSVEILIKDRGVVEIELNHAKGWKGTDISFLHNFPELLTFDIIDLKIPSVAPVNSLNLLKELSVITYDDAGIEFSNFSQLEDCSLQWRDAANSVFECRSLKRLFLNGYEGRRSDVFEALDKLVDLRLLNSPLEEIQGVGNLTNLESLSLGNFRSLSSLEGMGRLTRLVELEINTCRKISSIEELRSLKNLRRLLLLNDGNIDSMAPLRDLTKLEEVLFYESTNVVDGDLSPLEDQKNLKKVSFRNRRHYTHRREDFGDA